MIQRIFDSTFDHALAASHGAKPSFFKWDRTVTNYHTCWITDKHIRNVRSIPGRRKIAWLIEPRTIIPGIYDFVAANLDQFDYVLTFDRQLISINPTKVLYYAFCSCWVGPADRMIYPKSKLISMVASKKNDTEGHQLRHHVAAQFRSMIDTYGYIAAPLINKADGLRDYMFSMAILNSKIDDYFTEYLNDCFVTATVPIYWGTSNIGNYYDREGIIQFNDIDELKGIIPRLNQQLYQSMMPHIINNFKIAADYMVSEDWIFSHYPFLFDQ